MDKDLNSYGLDTMQIVACMQVEKAIAKANSMGVSFWNDNGILTAFNGEKITLPAPRRNPDSFELTRSQRTALTLPIKIKRGGFHAGNQEEMLWFRIVKNDQKK